MKRVSGTRVAKPRKKETFHFWTKSKIKLYIAKTRAYRVKVKIQMEKAPIRNYNKGQRKYVWKWLPSVEEQRILDEVQFSLRTHNRQQMPNDDLSSGKLRFMPHHLSSCIRLVCVLMIFPLCVVANRKRLQGRLKRLRKLPSRERRRRPKSRWSSPHSHSSSHSHSHSLVLTLTNMGFTD